jgi:hypothetical protein
MSGSGRADLIRPHERSIPGSEQEFRVDQRTQQRVARSAIQSPQPLCLRRRQTQSGHFDVFALNPSEYVVKRMLNSHQ